MAYSKDLSNSARRHLRAAEELYSKTSGGSQPGCMAVAGYLFGLTGELAVKEIMRTSGMKPLIAEERHDDPFYAHFPDIKTRLRDTACGRRSAELRILAEKASLFQYWDTNMRYAPTSDVQPAWVNAWQISARELVDQMEQL